MMRTEYFTVTLSSQFGTYTEAGCSLTQVGEQKIETRGRTLTCTLVG